MNSNTGHRLVPKLWDTLPDYTRQSFVADLIAGITVGLVALPLAMAFAISSGVPPVAGIYTYWFDKDELRVMNNEGVEAEYNCA